MSLKGNGGVEFADFTKDEGETVLRIVDRAVKMAKKTGGRIDELSLHMDIAATHASNPLRLDDLEKADDFNFVHDIYGIMRHLDRNTGLLTDCFVPRFSKRG